MDRKTITKDEISKLIIVEFGLYKNEKRKSEDDYLYEKTYRLISEEIILALMEKLSMLDKNAFLESFYSEKNQS